MTHGMLVYFLGSDVQHAPMYCGVWVFMMLLVRPPGFRWDGTTIILISAFAALINLSFVISGADGTYTGRLVQYIKPLLLCLIATGAVLSRSELSKVSMYLLSSAVLGAGFNIYQQYTGTQVVYDEWDPLLSRAASLSADPNDTAMLMLAAVPFAALKVVRRGPFMHRFAYAGVTALIVGGIVLTGSRAGFIILLLVALSILIVSPCRKRLTLVLPSRAKMFTVLAGVFVAVLFFAPSYYWPRIATLITGKEVGSATSLYNRQQLLSKGMDAWLQNPLLGVGPGQYYTVLNGSNTVYQGERGSVAHNMYIEFLVEFGLLGLCAFLAIIVTAWLRLVRSLDVDLDEVGTTASVGYGYAIAFAAMLGMGFTLSQGYNPILWLFIGFGLAIGGSIGDCGEV